MIHDHGLHDSRLYGYHSSAIAGDTMDGGYQRRTQKGMGRKGKFPEVPGTKTQRLCAAFAETAENMVRFFCISIRCAFKKKV